MGERSENQRIERGGDDKTFNDEWLVLVQITASRKRPGKVLKAPAARPRAPTCIRVPDLGRLFEICRIQFRCSMSSPFAQEGPSGGRKHKEYFCVFCTRMVPENLSTRRPAHVYGL